MNILKRKFWSARWQWCFNLWFLQTYVKNNSYLKKPDDLLQADMLSKPVMKWLKSLVHFLITRAVLASSSYFDKKIQINIYFLKLIFGKILPDFCWMQQHRPFYLLRAKLFAFPQQGPHLSFWPIEKVKYWLVLWIEIFMTLSS